MRRLGTGVIARPRALPRSSTRSPLQTARARPTTKGNMGKAEDRRAAIVAKQAAREATERAERLLHGPPPSSRKQKATRPRGRPPRPF